MFNSPRNLRNRAAKRCAICDGKFGLIRYYSWRTALCSKNCADRFKARVFCRALRKAPHEIRLGEWQDVLPAISVCAVL